MEKKTENQIKADKWVESHYDDATDTIKAVARASYYSGLIDKQEEMRDGHAI